jgi:hypothetical protein
MPNKEDQIMNLQRLSKATQTASSQEASKEDRRTAMAIIKQLTGRTNSLNHLALELMLEGTDQSQIVQDLVIGEGLSASEKVVLKEVMAQF